MTQRPPETARLPGAPGRLQRLVEAVYALHTALDLDGVLRRILETARDGVDADRGTVFLVDEEHREIWSRVLTGDGDLVIRLPVGQGVAGTVAATGEVVRLADARHDPRHDPQWDARSGYETRQLLTAPIRHRDGRVIGVFQLLNKRSGAFDEEDEAYLAALSVHAALAIENARLHEAALEKERQDREIGIVQAVQRAYQPERLEREGPGWRVAGLNLLCEDASGDYCDIVDLPGGRLGLAVGDVAGHGLGAALVMAQARAMLRAFFETVGDLPRVLNLLNDALARDLSGGRFMSLLVAVADPAGGRIEWMNAGHPPGIVWRPGKGLAARLVPHGRVLGAWPGAGFAEASSTAMARGDLLLLYTDGVTETRSADGRALEESGLLALLRAAARGPPARLLDAVRDALGAFAGGAPARDDLTLLAVERT